MEGLQTYFYIKVSEDQLIASLYCSEDYNQEVFFSENDFHQFLQENRIKYGIDEKMIELIASNPNKTEFPFIIAKGDAPQNGNNGSIKYEINYNNDFIKNPSWNFRDIMTIPSVKVGEKLATIYTPSKGIQGRSVYDSAIPAKSGKPVKLKAGKNTVLRSEDNSIYATKEGQISVSNQTVYVHSIFEVEGSLTMKTGNLDFVGSIVIKGDIPSGYKVRADGDIKVFGMVESAVIEAGGSIYIAEGLAGMQKGFLKAEENIHIGYINQGNVIAGKDLYVENSILHTQCTVGNQVYCQKGSIIGGTLTAGGIIEAKDIGNRLSTKTEIVFGVDKILDPNENEKIAHLKEIRLKLNQLMLLGEKLKTDQQNPATKLLIVKQRNSYEKLVQQEKEIYNQLNQAIPDSHEGKEASLLVNGQLHSNVFITFGKYKRVMDSIHNRVRVKLIKNEIIIQSK